MASAAISVEHNSIEDPLLYLPCARVVEYERGQSIYRQEPSSGLHLVIGGMVKVGSLGENGSEHVTDLYRSDDFFGESAFLGTTNSRESAVAMEKTKVMKWTTCEITKVAAERPRLAIALTQLFVQRTVDLRGRMESFVGSNIYNRLAWTLSRFADRFGAQGPNGWEHVSFPLTHSLLAQYIGTSREGVTEGMNWFRRGGCLNYSRRGFVLDRKAMKRLLLEGMEPKTMCSSGISRVIDIRG